MPRTNNCTHFKWHVEGQLYGNTISKKYFTLQTFLSEWGGDKTPLKLTRTKLLYIRGGRHVAPLPEFGLTFTPIKEARRRKTVTVYFDDATQA